MFVFVRSITNELYDKQCENFSDRCDSCLREYLNKHGNDARDAVTARYKEEMELISQFGYIPYYVLNRTIIDYAVKEKFIAYEGLTSSYSFAAFLYGITFVDPIRYGYDMKWAFGYFKDRRPAFQICVSSAFLAKAVSLLEGEFGKENIVCLEDDDQSVYEYQDKEYPYVQLTIKPLLDLAEGLYLDNGKDTSDRYEQISGKFRDPGSFCDENGNLKADYEHLKKILECTSSGAVDLDEQYQNVTYRMLLRCIAAGLGTGVTEAYRETVGSTENTIDKLKFPCTRDDAYNYLISCPHADPVEAWRLTEDIRKGKGSIPSVQDRLRNCGAEEWFCKGCAKIQYLVQEGRCVPLAQLYCLLADENDSCSKDGLICPSCGETDASAGIVKGEGKAIVLLIYLGGLAGFIYGTLRSLSAGLRTFPALYQDRKAFAELILDSIKNVLIFAVLYCLILDMIRRIVLFVQKKRNNRE